MPQKLPRPEPLKADSLKNVMDALQGMESSSTTSRSRSNSVVSKNAIANLIASPLKAPEAAEQLIAAMEESPAIRKLIVSHQGVSPLLDVLSPANSNAGPQKLAILRVLTEAAAADRSALELLLVAGIVPLLTPLCGKGTPLETRRIASHLVAQFLQTSPVTLHMFVACGGALCLVALLEPDESLQPAPVTTGGRNGQERSLMHSRGPPIDLGLVALDGVQRLFAETLAPPGSQRRKSFSRVAETSSFLMMSSSMASMTSPNNNLTTAHNAVSKSDFCSLFARTPLLDRLARFGDRLQTEEGRKESLKVNVAPRGALAEVCHVMTVFSRGSQAAKLYLARSSMALRFALTTLATRWAEAVVSRNEDEVDDDDLDAVKALLECLQNLASESLCLDALDAAGSIPALVPFLAVRLELLHERGHKVGGVVHAAANEVHNMAMVIIFYLVRLNQSRQEKAAACGLAKLAVQAVLDRTTVKSFALQIITDMCSASEFVRHCLFREGAVDFLLDTLIGSDVLWQDRSLNALSHFLCLAPTRTVSSASISAQPNQLAAGTKSKLQKEIERHLLRPSALSKFIQLFQSAKSEQFESVVKTFVSILDSNAKFAEAIGRSGVFIAEICARLLYPKAEVRIDLLRLLNLIANRHTDLETLLLDNNLFAMVHAVQQSAKQQKLVVVASHAEQLLTAWRPVLDRIVNS